MQSASDLETRPVASARPDTTITEVDPAAVWLEAAADYLRERLAQQRWLRDEQGGPIRMGRLGPAFDALQRAARVNPHLPIAWPYWPPGLWPKIVAALQKVTRRLLAWYINPIVEQQNQFNHLVLRALEDAYLRQQELARRLAELEARQAEKPPPE